MAEALRTKAIDLFTEHGLVQQANRLKLFGHDGYPEEPDFQSIAIASGVQANAMCRTMGHLRSVLGFASVVGKTGLGTDQLKTTNWQRHGRSSKPTTR